MSDDKRAEYRRLMYLWAQSLEAGTLSLQQYYRRLEAFVETHNVRDRKRLELPGAFPHEALAKLEACAGMFTWSRLLLFAPTALVKTLVREGFMPLRDEMDADWWDLARVACRNPDQSASMLQYLVEAGLLPRFEPQFEFILEARSERTVRFLLERGCRCENESIAGVLCAYDPEPGVKAKIVRALLESGMRIDYLPEKMIWMDLETWRVLEHYVDCRELQAWVQQSHHDIVTDRIYGHEMWPHLIQHYGVHFSDEDYRMATLGWVPVILEECEYVDDYVVDKPLTEKESEPFVLTNEWLKERITTPHEMTDFYRRLATLINYHPTPPPFDLGGDLLDLDRWLHWTPRTTRYFSQSLRLRVFTLLCVMRRVRGSTVWFKPLLPPIAEHMARYPSQKDSGFLDQCSLQ